MDKKSFIETSLKKALARRDEYISEYERVAETINNRIADRMAADPNFSPWDAPRQAFALMGEIERVENTIKKYKKDLEEIS
jgi:hypothetical protein